MRSARLSLCVSPNSSIRRIASAGSLLSPIARERSDGDVYELINRPDEARFNGFLNGFLLIWFKYDGH